MQVNSTGLELASYRGGIALIGPALIDITRHFNILRLPKDPLHITLLTSSEYKAAGKPQLGHLNIQLDRIYVLGLVTRKNVRFLVVVWNHADYYRKSLGLGKKSFHLTLSDEDDHEMNKSVSALMVNTSDRDEILDNVVNMGEDAMDHFVVGCWDDSSLVSPKRILHVPYVHIAYNLHT